MQGSALRNQEYIIYTFMNKLHNMNNRKSKHWKKKYLYISLKSDKYTCQCEIKSYYIWCKITTGVHLIEKLPNFCYLKELQNKKIKGEIIKVKNSFVFI